MNRIIFEGEDFNAEFVTAVLAIPGQLRHLHNQQGVILAKLNSMEARIMATLDEVIQDTIEEKTMIESLITLFQGVQQQLADVLSGTVIPPAVQEKIDAIFTNIEASKAEVAAALTTNVPPTP